jgi:hypothetical protein
LFGRRRSNAQLFSDFRYCKQFHLSLFSFNYKDTINKYTIQYADGIKAYNGNLSENKVKESNKNSQKTISSFVGGDSQSMMG